MKYLLDFLSSVPDAPTVQDGAFQQLIVDVHAGKSQSRSNDQFYESLEKIVNELRSSPEAAIFLKPVSKKDAPDYADVIKHPMDLSTVLRNVKAQKYKNKASFERDLDLIWENCLIYNAMEGHPLRATARYMRQKAEHHLEYLQDRMDRRAGSVLHIPGIAGSPAPSPSMRNGPNGAMRADGPGANGMDEDEDAPGEEEDGDVVMMNGDGIRQNGDSAASRAASAAPRPNGVPAMPFRDDRPNLTPNLDSYPALVRTPFSMTHFTSSPSSQPGSSYAEKGKAKESISTLSPPAWYPAQEDGEGKAEGGWWTAFGRDEAYTAGLPAMALVPRPVSRPQKRIPRRHRTPGEAKNGSTSASAQTNGNGAPPQVNGHTHTSPPKRTVNLETIVHRTVDELHTSRSIINSIYDWQRLEAEGGAIPPIKRFDREKEIRREEEAERKRVNREEGAEASKRRKLGGEVGERQAALGAKRATAGMLAHAGFDGANEAALDLFTKMATEHMRNMGRTFRLLLDGFSGQMSPEASCLLGPKARERPKLMKQEIMLHALFENGLVRPHDLESHIKDEIEREGAKVAEMTRKVKQAYNEVTTAPVIEDDMMFADSGEMLTDGNFADELGEDFLGLRDLGVAREHGMTNLTIPANLFYGRKKRMADTAAAGKSDALDYALPPPFIPLNATTYTTQLPALLHAFFAARIEAGLGLDDDPAFDAPHSIIGSLGQVNVKPPATTGAAKKKAVPPAAAAASVAVDKKAPVKKPSIQGIGKGNWIRPKKAATAGKNGPAFVINGSTAGSANGVGEEEDAEGEEE